MLGFVNMSVAELVEDIKYFQVELRNLQTWVTVLNSTIILRKSSKRIEDEKNAVGYPAGDLQCG
jgi:hypothetical protein